MSLPHQETCYATPMTGRPSLVKPFAAFVKEALAENPHILAVDLFERAKTLGYTGAYPKFSQLVKALRPTEIRNCGFCSASLGSSNYKLSNGAFCNKKCKASFHTQERTKRPGNGQCYICRQPALGARLCAKCRAKKNTSTNAKRLENRLRAIAHYGGHCVCPGCNETRVEFLAFDHIEGGGNKHRQKLGNKQHFGCWLVKNGFPAFIRLLCHNCNMARGYCGYCPHEREI